MIELSGRYSPIRQFLPGAYFQVTKASEMASTQVGQRPEPPDSPEGEIEQLLDVEGLLEIAQLIRRVREEGRLSTQGEIQTEHIDIHRAHPQKNQ